jgi:hypothetical protein
MRPVLSETTVFESPGILGGEIKSGAITVDNPACRMVRFIIDLGPDILLPETLTSWSLLNKPEGKTAFAAVVSRRGSANGAPDNEQSPAYFDIQTPVGATGKPLYWRGELMLLMTFAGKETGVQVQVTAQQLGEDDGE